MNTPDSEELAQLFRSHHRRIYLTVLRFVRQPAIAEDVVQEAFLRAWKSWNAFRGESSRETWICGIAIRCAWQAARSEGKHVGADVDELAHLESPGRLPHESSIDLERAIARLPPRGRAVFVLRDVEGFSVDEVAALLDMATGTVKAHLFQARKRLITLIEPA